MLLRINAAIAEHLDLLFETTLATLMYAQKIPVWRADGYRVSLIYLRLPDVEASIRRVRHRVASGGHDIPESIIRQRFIKSRVYLEEHYKQAVDEWYIWDSLPGEFKLRETGYRNG